jgi:hypothetical protein
MIAIGDSSLQAATTAASLKTRNHRSWIPANQHHCRAVNPSCGANAACPIIFAKVGALRF